MQVVEQKLTSILYLTGYMKRPAIIVLTLHHFFNRCLLLRAVKSKEALGIVHRFSHCSIYRL